jgi:hypothetical protein
MGLSIFEEATQSMSDLTSNLNEAPITDLRAQERARFIRQQRFRPTFWIASAGAYIRYLLVLMLFCFLVISPAVFYWGSQLASQYDLDTLSQLLTHVGVESTVSAEEPVSAEPATEEDALPVNPVGVAIWGLTGLAACVLGWFLAPIKSPLQRAADRHMMAWAGGSTESIRSPTPPPPKEGTTANNELAVTTPSSPDTPQHKVEGSHA